MQESIWQKKSRIQWCKLGDKNTRFFHLSAATRTKKSAIFCRNSNGKLVSKPSVIKMEIAKKVYSVDKRFRSSSSNLDFHKPLPSSSSALEDPFSMEKVKVSI
ncbi:hypothetical protein OIU85_023022 [Salix viminalis]|uniref:Uncharacterized protein n=1 Tax=Salix viminalis TaxID=40686 RepID=A0A9Q0U835_SALVM|nr:hypothetical protein OIU85_023022 [Salix viminalis]